MARLGLTIYFALALAIVILLMRKFGYIDYIKRIFIKNEKQNIKIKVNQKKGSYNE